MNVEECAKMRQEITQGKWYFDDDSTCVYGVESSCCGRSPGPECCGDPEPQPFTIADSGNPYDSAAIAALPDILDLVAEQQQRINELEAVIEKQEAWDD